jgi:MoxR-like ATPase
MADLLSDVEACVHQLAAAQNAIQSVILGQDAVVEQTLCALLAGGHALLVGVPGVAKTKLVQTVGVVLGLPSKRVQFTPDLLPADILGSEVLEETADGRRVFRFVPGPVFCQLLMADEINRASPRTQSALLQAMQEQEVTVAGRTHALPSPYHVLATQNPIEQEGTYPLPEAQLDRFLLQIDLDYPSAQVERDILLATTGAQTATAQSVMTANELSAAQALVRRMPIPDKLLSTVVDLVRSARPGPEQPDLIWGAGPRAGQALLLTCRARALLKGRLSPVLEDVLALAPAALRHRLALSYTARAQGKTPTSVISSLLGQLNG